MNTKKLLDACRIIVFFLIFSSGCFANEEKTAEEKKSSEGVANTNSVVDQANNSTVNGTEREEKQKEFIEKKHQKIENNKLNFLEDEKEDEVPPVPQLSGESFDEVVSKGFWFVGFVTPTCEACKHLRATWKTLAREIAKISTKSSVSLQLAVVDLTTAEEIGERFGVEHVPTMILFKNGKKIATYEADQDRTTFSFLSFLQEHTEIFEHSPTALIQVINDSNTEKLEKGEWVVAFLIPWELQSNKLSGVWYHLAKKVKVDHNTTLQVGLVFCVEKMKLVCQEKFKIENFPAVKYLDLEENIQVSFAQDRKRDVEQFVEFLNVQMKDSPFSDFSYADLRRAMERKVEPSCVAADDDDELTEEEGALHTIPSSSFTSTSAPSTKPSKAKEEL